MTTTSRPGDLWLAVDMHPESSEVHVATSRDGAIEAIRDTIGAHEWQQFQDSLARNGEPGADMTLDAPADDVVQHFFGPYEPAEDEGEDAFFVNEFWLVRPAVVRGASVPADATEHPDYPQPGDLVRVTRTKTYVYEGYWHYAGELPGFGDREIGGLQVMARVRTFGPVEFGDGPLDRHVEADTVAVIKRAEQETR